MKYLKILSLLTLEGDLHFKTIVNLWYYKKIEECDVEYYLTEEFLYENYWEEFVRNEDKYYNLVSGATQGAVEGEDGQFQSFYEELKEKHKEEFEKKILKFDTKVKNFTESIREVTTNILFMYVAFKFMKILF